MNTYLLVLGYQLQPFSLKISGKMERDGKKFGIGSSGSGYADSQGHMFFMSWTYSGARKRTKTRCA